MPEYRSYGKRDDRIARDGDVGFVGFNNRLRPDQLQAGMLADAQNVRLDRNGEAQVRKGIDLIEAPFGVGGDVLRLPVISEIGTNIFRLPTTIESASLTSNVVSLVLNDPAVLPGHEFLIGDIVQVEGLQFVTTDPNGTHTLTGVTSGGGITTLTFGLTGGDETYSAAIVLPETLPFTLNGITTQAVVGYQMVLDQGQVTEVYASTDYSDPSANASQYILLASNLKVVAKNLNTGETQDIIYPTGETVPPLSDMIQAFNKVFIFRDGQTALEWDGDFSGTPAFTKVASGEYTQPVQIACAAGEFALINGRGIVHQEDGVSVGDTISVIGDKTLSGDQTSGFIVGETFVASKIFTGGPNQSITSATSTLISGGEFDGLNKVTATVTAHGYDIGDPIDVSGYTSPDTDINGPRFVTEKTDDTFVFYVDGSVSTSPSAGTPIVALAHGFEFFFNSNQTSVHVTDGVSLSSTPVFSRPLSVGLGFSHMPAPSFAVYHQRRLIMPFRYTVDTALDSFTSNERLDEIIASDILDSDTYDQIYAQYRFNAGTADFVVGLHSFSEDVLLVFNRNSIHQVANSENLQTATTRLLTDEVGCVARKSIVQVGNRVIFLSDNGVYGTEFFDEYNLRGTETPLSEPINETISRINKDAWENSVATYFDNRYFIAVPLDNAVKNTAVLVYNFLNKQWESIDTVGDGSIDWDIENLIVAGNGSQRGVYAINQLGGIHRLDFRVDGQDRVVVEVGGSSITPSVETSVTTRQYTLGALERKSWKQFEVHAQSSDDNTSDFDISAEVENPDIVIPIGALSDYNITEQRSVNMSEFSDSSLNGTYIFDSIINGFDVYRLNGPGAASLPAVSFNGSIIYVFRDSTTIPLYQSFSNTITSNDFRTLFFLTPVDGSSVDSTAPAPASLPIGEDVSIRGRIGNRRGYGVQFTINNTQGRPRIRAIQVEGSTAMRSTQTAI